MQESDAAEENKRSSDSKKRIADYFFRLADLPTSALDRLSRYEHMLVAASATDCDYAGVVAAPQATAEPLNLFICVPAARAWRLVRRVQVITREPPPRGLQPLSLQPAMPPDILWPLATIVYDGNIQHA